MYDRDELITRFYPYVTKVVYNYFGNVYLHQLNKGSLLTYGDFKAEGYKLLVEAVDKVVEKEDEFDTIKAVSSYIWKTIRGGLYFFGANHVKHGLTGVGPNKYYKIIKGEQEINSAKDVLDTAFVQDSSSVKSLDQTCSLATPDDSLLTTVPSDIKDPETQLIERQEGRAKTDILNEAIERTKRYYSRNKNTKIVVNRCILGHDTQADVAEDLGVSQQIISKMCKSIHSKVKYFADRVRPNLDIVPDYEEFFYRDLTDAYPEKINIGLEYATVKYVREVSDSAGGSFNVISYRRK